MGEIEWEALGFTKSEAIELNELPAGRDQFSLDKQLSIWRQWVHELEKGELWTPEELESASDAREDIDLSIQDLPERYRERVYIFLDELDRIFRRFTVSSGTSANRKSGQWWHGRVPVRNRQRLYLLEDNEHS